MKALGSAFVLKLCGGAIAFVMILGAIVILRPGDRLTQLLVGITAVGTLFQAFTAIDFWFQSQVQSKYSAYVRSAAFLIVSAAKVVLVLLHAPLTAFAWAGVADIFLGSLGLIIAYRVIGLHMTDWRTTRAMAKELLRDSWPLMFSDILILIYMRVDKIMIGEMAGNTELGIYSVAVLIAEVLYFIPLVINSSVFPSIVEAKGIDEDLFDFRQQKLYNLMAFFAYAVALPVTILSGWLIPLMFGTAYSKAGPMLVGLVWAGVFINFMIARSNYLTAMNWTRLHFIIDLLGCVMNVATQFFPYPTLWSHGRGVCLIYHLLVCGARTVFCIQTSPQNRYDDDEGHALSENLVRGGAREAHRISTSASVPM